MTRRGVVDRARGLFATGEHDAALALLRDHRPAHAIVAEAIEELQLEAEEIARRRREEEARREQRNAEPDAEELDATVAVRPDPVGVGGADTQTARGAAFEAEVEPTLVLGSAPGWAAPQGEPSPGSLVARFTRSRPLQLGAVVLLAIAIATPLLLRGGPGAVVDLPGELPGSEGPALVDAPAVPAPPPIDRPPVDRPPVDVGDVDTAPAPVADPGEELQPRGVPAADPVAAPIPVGSVSIDIAPWAEITRLRNVTTGEVIQPAIPVTPCVLTLPVGRYEILFVNPSFRSAEFAAEMTIVAGTAIQVRGALPGLDYDDALSGF